MIGERGPGWGVDWGTPGEIPEDARRAAGDAAAAAIFAEARKADREPPPVLLLAGDLASTLGARAPHESEPQPAQTVFGVRMSVDVGVALVDGRLHWFVAHLVARRSWWRGRLLVAANASFIGRWNAAPRSHPGDGRLDVFDADPSLRVRLAARRRLPSGTHVPHPGITQRRITAAQYDLTPGLDVRIDGVRTGRARSLSLRVEPGALEVWIPSAVGSQP
ncbi:MAG: hypothetical protein OXE79_09145 [Acidimicrobiaceae bacterium]|nr:hypothetical protein [Acidimicrobiaceae bacterium]MCY4280673.1 hypothetical protein [Acidimicrobiaceae bacterium]MCY4294846.1 hypothetical protein [Acidimicrobiaceae bacterium]